MRSVEGKKLFLAGVLGLLAALAAGPSAAAGDTTCIGVVTGPHDNVVVPPGASCTLAGAEVLGNVKALEDLTLFVFASTVHGDVQGDKAREVRIQFESQVGGDVQVKGTDAGSFNAVDIRVRIGGDVQFEENEGMVFVDAALIAGNVDVIKNTGGLEIEFNTVGGNIEIEENVVLSGMSVLGNRTPGNLQVSKNAGAGAKQVMGNIVGQNLQCFDSTPPFLGGPNTAAKAEGQCF